MLVAQIWVSQQGQSLILSQHDPISSWLCLTLLYVDTNHWSLISQTQTSNSVGLGDRHCDGFSQPTETIEICPISHGHGMGNHQAGIPSAQGESPNLTVSLLTDAKAQSMIFQAFHTQSESMFVPQALWNGVRRPKYLTIWPPLLSISRKNQATLMHHICSQKDLGGTYTGLSACMVSDFATKAIIPIYPYCLAAKTVWSKCFDTQNIADQNSTSLSCHFPSQSGRSVGRAICLSSSMLSSALGPWTLWAHLDRWDDGVMWVMWVWIPPCTSLNPSKLQNRLCWAKERPKTLACSANCANVRDARGVGLLVWVWEGHSKQCVPSVLCIFVELDKKW